MLSVLHCVHSAPVMQQQTCQPAMHRLGCRLVDLTALDAVMTDFESHMDAADRAADAAELFGTLELLPLVLRGDHTTLEGFLLTTLQKPSNITE